MLDIELDGALIGVPFFFQVATERVSQAPANSRLAWSGGCTHQPAPGLKLVPSTADWQTARG